MLGTVPTRLDAKHAVRERALYDCSLKDVDPGDGPGMRAEVLDKAVVVEGATFGGGGVRDVHFLTRVEDRVAAYGDGINSVKTHAEA